MLTAAHRILYPVVNYLKRIERYGKIYRYQAAKKNVAATKIFKQLFGLSKLVIYALVAVAIFYLLDIKLTKETLSFLQRDLFFEPLSMIVPVLLATAMFAVPQRIPITTLATIGISVIVTYLLTTMFSSSLGYSSVVLFDTAQYLQPLLTDGTPGRPQEFKTDFTLLHIIAASLLLSILLTYAVRKDHKLQQQIVFLSLFAEKGVYAFLGIILWFMPFAVFASILGALQTHGLDRLSSLGWFVLYVNLPQLCYLLLLIC